MPLSFTPPPQNITELTQARVQDLASQRQLTVAPLANISPTSIRLDSGHPVYNLGLQDVVGNKKPSEVSVNAWRFIVRAAPAAEPAAAETLTVGPSGQAEFSSVNAGPFVGGTEAAFAALTRDPALAQGDWEARLLRIPALYLFAIWVHSKQNGEDRFRPVQPAPSFVDPNRTYTWAEFQAAIKPAAQQKLETDDGHKG